MTATGKCPPSYSLLGYVLNTECNRGNAFTFVQKHGGVARAVLDFWFVF